MSGKKVTTGVLTPLKEEILRMYAVECLSPPLIGKRMCRSTKTIESHLEQIGTILQTTGSCDLRRIFTCFFVELAKSVREARKVGSNCITLPNEVVEQIIRAADIVGVE